jgi:hypothetical protein
MPYTLDEIVSGWLGDAEIAVPPQTVVDAFNRAERLLGKEWVVRARTREGGQIITGADPTLRVVRMGQELASLEGIVRVEKLITAVQKGDQSARAELMAINILRDKDFSIQAELYPTVSVGNRQREPDFRVRKPSDQWTYVEVTRPDVSELHLRLTEVMEKLLAPVVVISKSFALEVFFRREPTNDELPIIIERITSICNEAQGIVTEELPAGLGLLLLNHCNPMQIVPKDLPEEPNLMRLGQAKAIGGGGEPARHIAVRMPYADSRARQFLAKEARQLPKDAPGLIVVDIVNAPGGIKSWEPLLQRALQPSVHTRIGGICIFMPCLVLTDDGIASLLHTKFIPNPHATLPLPPWIPAAISSAGAEYEKQMAKKTQKIE